MTARVKRKIRRARLRSSREMQRHEQQIMGLRATRSINSQGLFAGKTPVSAAMSTTRLARLHKKHFARARGHVEP